MVNRPNYHNFWMAMVHFGKKAILHTMFIFILFVVNVVIEIYNTFSIHKATGKQASMTQILLTGIFGIFSHTLT